MSIRLARAVLVAFAVLLPSAAAQGGFRVTDFRARYRIQDGGSFAGGGEGGGGVGGW